ncbi:MAG: sigma 54-interacting transcriptional regulator, partial [Betaproteobacteria bacterium]|nr:sigma 54-interacting transcriptional regulator [Betaproteobacteria bacterium]
IGELPLHMQTKLLHVIEDKEVRALGSEQVRRVDTRIIAATNRDLREMVRQGKFREDLYFRLSMFHIHIPPLRERQSDIRGLIHYFLKQARSDADGSYVSEIDPEAEELLLAYGWPGNVRELENVINRADILADGNCITVADLPQYVMKGGSAANTPGTAAREGGLRDQLRRIEGDIVQRAIEEAGGDRRAAAQKLGIGLSSLYRKIEELEQPGLIPDAASSTGRNR